MFLSLLLPSSYVSAYSRVDSDYADKYTKEIRAYKDDLMSLGYPSFEWGSSHYYCWTYGNDDVYANVSSLYWRNGVCDYCVVYDDKVDAVYIIFASKGLHCKFTSARVSVVGSGLATDSFGGICFASNGSDKFRYFASNGRSKASGDIDISIISGSLHLLGFYGQCYDASNALIEGIPDSTALPDGGGSDGGGGGSDGGSAILSRIGAFFDSFFDNLKNALKDLFIPSSDFMQSQIQSLKDDFSARFDTGTLSVLKKEVSNHNNTTTPEYFDKHFSISSFVLPSGDKMVHHGSENGLSVVKSVIFEKYQGEIRGFVRVAFYLLLIISDYNFIIWLLRSAPVSTGGGGKNDGGDSD